jgi:hypothetical protein
MRFTRGAGRRTLSWRGREKKKGLEESECMDKPWFIKFDI